jgi:hypothetical protein
MSRRRLIVPVVLILSALVPLLVTDDRRWSFTGLCVSYLAVILVLRMAGMRRMAATSSVAFMREPLPEATRGEDAADLLAHSLIPVGVLVWVWTGAWWTAVAGLVLCLVILAATSHRQNRRDLDRRFEADVERFAAEVGRWLGHAPETELDADAAAGSGGYQLLTREEAVALITGPGDDLVYNADVSSGYRGAVQRGTGPERTLGSVYRTPDGRILVDWRHIPAG